VNFNISELLAVLLVALVVIKPEQLSEVAQTLGKMLRSGRQLLAKTKNEMTGLIETVEKPQENKREQT